MEILSWIDKPIIDLKATPRYNKYFGNVAQETGIGVFTLFNPVYGIDLVLTNQQIVKSIHFYTENLEDNTRCYPDALPFTLNFESSREQPENY